jgi:hypothetical protein
MGGMGNGWEPIERVWSLSVLISFLGLIMMSYHILINGKYSFISFLLFFAWITVFISTISFFFTFWRGEQIAIELNGNKEAFNDAVKLLEDDLDLRKVDLHLHILPTFGQPVHYIEGNANRKIWIQSFSYTKLVVVLSRTTLEHKGDVENVLRSLTEWTG